MLFLNSVLFLDCGVHKHTNGHRLYVFSNSKNKLLELGYASAAAVALIETKTKNNIKQIPNMLELFFILIKIRTNAKVKSPHQKRCFQTHSNRLFLARNT